MNSTESLASKAGLVWAGLIAVTISLGAEEVKADTFRQGSSTATVEQSDGSTSRSKIIQYQDGQTVITRSGSSTDITIQGEAGPLAPDGAGGYDTWEDDWFDSERFEYRVMPGPYVFPEFLHSVEREAFKQEMLDRMRGRFRR